MAAGMQVASIGPVTSKTARDRGLTVGVEARATIFPGLVDAIRQFFAQALIDHESGDRNRS